MSASRRSFATPTSKASSDAPETGAGSVIHALRLGYDVSGATVEVLAIVVKSEAQSWLAQFGNPE